MSDQKIHAAMVSVMAAIGAVGKDGTNTQQQYKFRALDDVMNATHGALVAAGVFYTPEVTRTRWETIERQGKTPLFLARHTVRFTFFAADGSSVCVTTIGEGADYGGDKASNKAMSAALKYALLQTFCIPTHDMADGDSETVTAPPSDWVPAAKNRAVDYATELGAAEPKAVAAKAWKRVKPKGPDDWDEVARSVEGLVSELEQEAAEKETADA